MRTDACVLGKSGRVWDTYNKDKEYLSMDTSWYRQYFWLLVFAGIIVVTAIITLIMVCLCRTQFSKRLSLRIQKSFRQNSRNQRQRESSAVILQNSIYTSSPRIIKANPDLRLDSNRQAPQQNTFPVYAMAQKKEKQLQYGNADYEQEQTGKEYADFVPEWEDMRNGEYIDVLPEDDENDESYDDVQF
ncbi:uncharacterized protein LOC108709674 isoform X2 [Xenopus laevis]|uniref:Uncharacterized protein LOC108709674 isoform X2 n=1 Tax=Xenopus laevis TaxID=8355 RepID=A0A8J1MED2_XENLA|nr:uncharacterized protein LOC108709674 isoform X2 [Xenopus laevis]